MTNYYKLNNSKNYNSQNLLENLDNTSNKTSKKEIGASQADELNTEAKNITNEYFDFLMKGNFI